MKPLEIICNETGVVYSSLTEASNKVGVTLSNLSRHLKGHPGRPKVNGYTFSYLDTSISPYTEEEIKKLAIEKNKYDREYWDRSGRDKYLVSNREKKQAWRKNGGREKERQYQNEREKNDPAYRLIRRIRKRHWAVLKGLSSTTEGLGCDRSYLRTYIENLWGEGMNWDNYGYGPGKWVIDHIIPLASYEKTGEGEWNTESHYNKKLLHYTNLGPMWYEGNRDKGDSIDPNDLAVFLERVIEL